MKVIVRLAGKILLLSVACVVGVCRAEGFYVGIGYGGLESQSEYYVVDNQQDNMSLQVGYAVSPTIAFEALYSKSLSGSVPGFYSSGNYPDVFWGRLISESPGMTMEEAQTEFPDPQGWTKFSKDLTYVTTAFFGVFKTSGNPYIKTRAGFSTVELTTKYRSDSFEGQMVADDGSVFSGVLDRGDEDFDVYADNRSHTYSERDTDISVGFGAGYKMSPKLFAELEFTRFNKNSDYYSVSINYDF
jgi:hypothetical protein